jgi:hypothetical protein
MTSFTSKRGDDFESLVNVEEMCINFGQTVIFYSSFIHFQLYVVLVESNGLGES